MGRSSPHPVPIALWVLIHALAWGGKPWVFPGGGRLAFSASNDQRSAETYGFFSREATSKEAVPGARRVSSSFPRR